MIDGSHSLQDPNEPERYAYNAAFHELGFNWYWDSSTHEQLMQLATTPAGRLRHYLQSRQPHLLQAYDADFLVAAIEAAKTRHAWAGMALENPAASRVDWAQMSRCQLGA